MRPRPLSRSRRSFISLGEAPYRRQRSSSVRGASTFVRRYSSVNVSSREKVLTKRSRSSAVSANEARFPLSKPPALDRGSSLKQLDAFLDGDLKVPLIINEVDGSEEGDTTCFHMILFEEN